MVRLSPRAGRIDASGIRKVFDLAAKLENPINLSIGQPDFDVPDEVKAALKAAVDEGKNRYSQTQGIAPLREALRSKIAKEKGIDVPDEGFLVTSGVSGGLFLAFLALFGPGDEVLVPDPYFVMYKHLLNVLDAKPVFVDTYPDGHLTAERIEAAVTPKTKAVVFATPANPTGVALSREELTEIAEVCGRRGLFVIADEIYDAFLYEGEPFSIGRVHPETLTLGGFSKSHAMTGWRLGWAAGPVEVVRAMTMFQQFTFVNAPTPAQWAGLAALEVDTTPHRDAYRKKRDRIASALSEAGYDFPHPGGAFYLFPRVPDGRGTATEFCSRLIEESSLLVIPGGVFSERDTHFRISYAADDETIERGIAILARDAKG